MPVLPLPMSLLMLVHGHEDLDFWADGGREEGYAKYSIHHPFTVSANFHEGQASIFALRLARSLRKWNSAMVSPAEVVSLALQ